MELRNLNLTFPEKGKVFNNINIKIKENKITLLTGKSGCGKSSLLMCIARVIPETIDGRISGEIIYKGKNIEKAEAVDISGEIAYMFQDPDSQLCTFTVKDEIAFGLENLNINPNDMDEKISNALSMAGISHLRDKQLNHLSGGEKQKVALASIIALDADFILMDEPTANLDPKSTYDIVKLIQHLRDKMGKTILIVEHKINEFSEIIDEVISFNKDNAVLIDKHEFLESYNKEFNLPKRKKMNIKSKAILNVSNLFFSYDNKKEVLENISFSLNNGEITAITGPNGAGKSTLAKLLMGLLKPNCGRIIVNNQDLKNIDVHKLGESLGMVFQNPEHQFIKMTVEKEMSLSLEIRGKDAETINTEVGRYLSLFDLYDHKSSNPFSLSQGQKRRLSTASMMINGQTILILDEPTYGQDRENLIKLINLLYKVNSEGTSILMITHDMDMVLNCCDRVIYIDNKNVSYDGSVEAFIEKCAVNNEVNND